MFDIFIINLINLKVLVYWFILDFNEPFKLRIYTHLTHLIYHLIIFQLFRIIQPFYQWIYLSIIIYPSYLQVNQSIIQNLLVSNGEILNFLNFLFISFQLIFPHIFINIMGCPSYFRQLDFYLSFSKFPVIFPSITL